MIFIKKIFLSLFFIMILIYTLFPFYWAVVTSFRTGSALFQMTLIPNKLDWTNYRQLFVQQPFLKNIWNSFLTSALSILIAIPSAMFCAYLLVRRQFRGKKVLFFSFIIISMFPQVSILSGMFELIRQFKLYDQCLGLALAYLIFNLPFSIWALSTFITTVPKGIEEAAIVDGANTWQIFWRIFFPILLPGFLTISLLSFINSWNEFLFAITLTLTNNARTVPVAIALMSGASQHELPWGNIMAASVIATIPLTVLVFVFQKRVVSGLTLGSLKG